MCGVIAILEVDQRGDVISRIIPKTSMSIYQTNFLQGNEMKVIADLHGGDPEDLIAKAEFQEIKDRVIFEVSDLLRARWISVNQRKA